MGCMNSVAYAETLDGESLQAVRITNIRVKRGAGVDANTAMHQIERQMLHWRHKSAVQHSSNHGKQKGHIESTSFMSNDKLSLRSDFSSMKELHAADKEERALINWLQRHTHTAGGGDRPFTAGHAGDIDHQHVTHARNSSPSPFYGQSQELIGTRVWHAAGQAEMSDGPLPSHWTMLPVKASREQEFLQDARDSAQKILKENPSIVSCEFIFAVDHYQVFPTMQAILCFIFDSADVLQAHEHEMATMFSECPLLVAKPEMRPGHVDWAYHAPATPIFNKSARRFVREQLPSFKQEMHQTMVNSRRRTSSKTDALHEILSRRSEDGAHPRIGSHGHAGALRLKLASPVRRSLKETKSKSSADSLHDSKMFDDKLTLLLPH